MLSSQIICCPNCGSPANRRINSQLTRTECPACDYLMITSFPSARVIEAYAPSLSAARLRQKAHMNGSYQASS